ncbi:MAG: hypothetical protein DYG94_04855 [Leptolyngbya sp. PLA3]|nr:MAG: hypothetical protein EDM82_04005 [Cyanobacteria bacterium CYA]MCE7968062.1 hypothetical protein [Leptolyngbya sp. PL-A3]
MRIEPEQSVTAGLVMRAGARTTAEQRSFAEILAVDDRARAWMGGVDQAQQAAEGLVAMTLIEPLLREAREMRSSEGPFGLTEAERQFGALMDARTAGRMVKAWNMPLVDQLARQMREEARTVETTGHEVSG